MGNLGFLASTWANDKMRDLRAQIHQLGVEMKRQIWVAECDAPELKQENGYDPLAVVDRCLDEIEVSDCFVIFLDSGIGTLVTFEKQVTASSFIELELFQAVMHEKPIHIVVIGDVPEDAASKRLLKLVSQGIQCEIRHCQDHFEAFEIAERIFRDEYKRSRRSGRRNKQALVGRLSQTKHRDFANQHLFQEIEFLGGQPLIIADVNPELDVVAALLADAAAQQHSNRKMSRVWLALRSLMHRHYADTDNMHILSLWEAGLRSWSTFAAWRGMHAHLWLGHISALGSLNRVLERQGRSIGDVRGAEHSDNLGGAFASAYYSLSKMAPREQSVSFLNRSALYVERSLAEIREEFQSGLYAIHGSINVRRSDWPSAIDDYTRALELAEQYEHSDARQGELLAELGWAEFRSGKITMGTAHLEEGVRVMDTANAGPGFRTRGKRKLAIAQLFTLSVPKAYKTARSASGLIREFGLYDQRDAFIAATDRMQRALKVFQGRK
jgi:hypothetical protein